MLFRMKHTPFKFCEVVGHLRETDSKSNEEAHHILRDLPDHSGCGICAEAGDLLLPAFNAVLSYIRVATEGAGEVNLHTHESETSRLGVGDGGLEVDITHPKV